MARYFASSTRGFYDSSLNSSIPPDAVEISDETWQSLLAGQSAGKAISAGGTGQPVLVDPASLLTLAAAQTLQRASMQAACAAAIVAGFTSSALGAPHSYGCALADQANIDRACVAGGSLWCADSSGTWSLTSHTATQAQQVRTDLWAHIQESQMKYAGLLGQISGATTVSAVQAVEWS